MRRFALVLYTTTALVASSTLASQGADINRVWDICSKRGTCHISMAAMEVMPAALTSGPIAQQRNPDPFHQFTPQAQAPQQQPQQQGQSPVVVPAPQVTVQAPPKEPRDFFDWILLGLGGIFTAIFGTKTLGDMRKPDLSKLDIGQLLQSDEFKMRVYNVAQQAIATGLPGAAIGAIPGVGSFEPIIRRVASGIVDQRLAQLGAAAQVPTQGSNTDFAQQPNPSMTTIPTAQLGDLVGGLHDLIAKLNQQHQQNPAQH